MAVLVGPIIGEAHLIIADLVADISKLCPVVSVYRYLEDRVIGEPPEIAKEGRGGEKKKIFFPRRRMERKIRGGKIDTGLFSVLF